MQLTPQLIASLLTALCILQPNTALALPVHPEQAILALRHALVPNALPGSSGLRLYRRLLAQHRKHSRHGLMHNSRRGLLKGASSVGVPSGIVSSFQLRAESDTKKSVIVNISRYRRANAPRSFFTLPFMRVTHEFVERGIAPDGVPGVIDIVSPTVDNPTGERLASLSVASNPSEANQFVLNVSGVNSTTVYLVVDNQVSLLDQSLAVRLEVPVYDHSRAAYTSYCTTFDMTQSSPLMVAECDPKGISDHNSQLFSYATDTGVIKPLWLSSASTQDTPSSNMTTVASEEPTSESVDAGAGASLNGGNLMRPAQNIALIFTPEIDGTVPVVNIHTSPLPSPSFGATSTEETAESNPTDNASPTATESTLPPDVLPSASSLGEPVVNSVQEGLPSPTMSLIFVVGSANEAEPTSTGDSTSIPDSGAALSTPTESVSPKQRRAEDPHLEVETGGSQDEDNATAGNSPEDQEDEPHAAEAYSGPDAGMHDVDTGYTWRFTARSTESYDFAR